MVPFYTLTIENRSYEVRRNILLNIYQGMYRTQGPYHCDTVHDIKSGDVHFKKNKILVSDTKLFKACSFYKKIRYSRKLWSCRVRLANILRLFSPQAESQLINCGQVPDTSTQGQNLEKLSESSQHTQITEKNHHSYTSMLYGQ